MFLEIIRCLLVFTLLSIGLAWPLAAKLPLSAVEKLVASLVLSLVALWLFGWTLYTWTLSWSLLWLLPPLAAAGLIWRRRELVALLRDPIAGTYLWSQLLVSLWTLGWLSLVQNYSGGGWTGDWFEHWERALFFLNRQPADHLFLGIYPLTARPPLGNVIMAVWLHLTQVDFPHYQLFSTLLGSLAFLPAALLAARWGGNCTTVVVLAVLFMVNPLFVQNSVFPWTKLPSALFVLTALYFFLRFRDGTSPRTSALLCSTALAAGLLTHYSAAPYVLALALGWSMLRPIDWRRLEFLRITALAAGAGAVLLATWFGWAFATYGITGTLATSTSVTTTAADAGGQLWRVLLNLRDTLVPHFLRSPDPALIAQTSPWGYARDWFFQVYQLNLFLALGSTGWLVVLREAWRLWPVSAPAARGFWAGFATVTGLLGVAVHGARDEWGLTHICLQPLVLLGLAFFATRWASLGRGWRCVATVGAVFDLICGIGLHFAVQNFAFDRCLTPSRKAWDVLTSYNPQTLANVFGLARNHLVTLNESLNQPPLLVLALLAALLLLALWQWHTSSSAR
jgi:hypothetical protein